MPSSSTLDPPTPDTARRDFVPLYATVNVLYITAPGLQHWTTPLPQHAIPATPGDHMGRFRYLTHVQRPSPFYHWVGIPNCCDGATSRFTFVTACCFANWELTTPCCQDAAPLSYRGESDNSPDGTLTRKMTQLLLRTVRPNKIQAKFTSQTNQATRWNQPSARFIQRTLHFGRPHHGCRGWYSH